MEVEVEVLVGDGGLEMVQYAGAGSWREEV